MKIIQQTNKTRTQMMGYVIQASSGEVLVIDGGNAGDADELERVIMSVGGHAHLWLMTHPHSDHYGAPIALLGRDTEVTFDRFGASVLTEEWGSALEEEVERRELSEWNAYAPTLGDKLFELRAGQKFELGSMTVEILAGANPEITQNPLNNQSCVIRVTEDGFRFLILGDLGLEAGCKLLESGIDLRADGVQMAHHGQKGVNEAFYRAVSPSYAFWPTPLWLWVNSRSRLIVPDSASFHTPITVEWMRRLKTFNVVAFSETMCFDTLSKTLYPY